MYGDFTFVNNVIFNYRHRTVDGGDHRSAFNVINNYFKPGPGTPATAVAYRLLKPESERSKVVFDNFGKAYVAGNFVEGFPKVSSDNWAGGVQPESKAPVEQVLPNIRMNEPFAHAELLIDSAQDAYAVVLANAGATRPVRDLVDQRVVEMVHSGKVTDTQIAPGSTAKAAAVGYASKYVDELSKMVQQGFITDPSEVGGYPKYAGQPYVDQDADGLPDDWERGYGLDPSDSRDAITDKDGNGYTNVEEFINAHDSAIDAGHSSER